VRAKVTSMLLDDQNITELDKENALKSAKNYYYLAWKYTQKSQGQIIIMSGLSGSGKSTVANYLAPKINAIHLRSDAVRKHLAGISLTQKGNEGLYSPEMNQKTYQSLLNLGILLVNQGFSVILDAKYDRHQWRSPVIETTQRAGIPLKILHCQASLETLKNRLKERKDDISDATSDLLAQQQTNTDAFDEREKKYVISVDTQREDWQLGINSWLN
jgi:predicted kinase